MPLDLSADHYVLDDLEDAVLTSEDGATAHTAYRLPDVTGEGDPSEGGYLHRDVTFHLPTKTAAGTPITYSPKPGDTETIAGVDYTVLAVQQPKHLSHWTLTCRRPSITADDTLLDTVTLYPAEDSRDAYGSKISVFTAAAGEFAGVAAKIMLRPSTVTEQSGQREFLEQYDIYVAQEISQLHHGDRLKDQDSNWYTITSYRNRTQIDELSVIECEHLAPL